MIYYVCVATENKLYLPYLKQLLPSLIILGMHEKWEGFIMKYKLLLTFLKNLKEDDIVCVIDAYDVLPTKYVHGIEKKFIKLSKKYPSVKMVVAGGIIQSTLQKRCNDYIFDSDTLNSGTYIGYAQYLLHILTEIMKTPNITDDQVELIRYSKEHPKDIYMDKRHSFFYTVSSPLQQIHCTKKCFFVHANGNGLLDEFLLKHHQIHLSDKIRTNLWTEHFICINKKIKLYAKHVFKNFLLNARRLDLHGFLKEGECPFQKMIHPLTS